MMNGINDSTDPAIRDHMKGEQCAYLDRIPNQSRSTGHLQRYGFATKIGMV
jgi:hypothetical protein